MDYAAWLVLIGRILYGGFFIMSGYGHLAHLNAMAGYSASKKVPSPKAAVAISGLLIIFGGLGILLGLWIRWAVLAIVLFLVPVTYMMHDYWNVSDPAMKANQSVMFKKNVALLGAALMLLAIPTPWMWSL